MLITFLTLIIGQVEKWHSWSTKEGECMFVETQSLKVLLVAAFYCIITLLRKRESAMRKECDHKQSAFWLYFVKIPSDLTTS